MHRFPSTSTITRFRFGAILFILRFILPAVGFPLLVWSMLTDERTGFVVSCVILGFFPIVIMTQWVVASKVRCPLCLAPPLLHRSCARNRKARRLFFSYRMRVVVTSLFSGYFRCPYCGEPSEMRARQRRRMDQN